MKLLLKAAFRTKKHFTLVLVTFLALIMLTISNQMEMFSLGVISSKGADFFALFGNEQGVVSLHDVQDKWAAIDTENTGVITQGEASVYLNNTKHPNPLTGILHTIEKNFDFSEEGLYGVILLIMLVAVTKALATFFSRYCTQLLAIRVSRDLRKQYFEHIQSLSMSFYHKYNIGALSSRVVGDSSQIAQSLNSFITNYLHAPFTIITTLVACIYLSWQLSLVIFVGIPLVAMPVVLLMRKVKQITRLLQKNQERFSSVLIDFLSGVQTVKIFGMESFSLKKYEEQNAEMAHLESKTAKYDLLTRPILHTITTFCLVTVLLFGLYALQMSMSQLFVFCGCLYLFYEPVKKFAEENANIQKGAVAAERLYEVLNLLPQIADAENAVEMSVFEEKIEFDDVWFRYKDEWVLKGVSFEVKKGETIALVGATGAGKSTIVQLLPRLYDVQKGEIRIDGLPLQAYSQRSLREQIAFVSQKPFLFYDTVAQNIAFGRDFARDEIELAAKRAHAHEFITLLPEKYDTMLEETGKNFSGGQQQRIAIARALIKKSPILILDEATSSLDAISEAKIKRSITELKGKVTQILIAHRLTTIEHADRIIFLQHGEKLAEGTREELLETCPEFELLWRTHFAHSSTMHAPV